MGSSRDKNAPTAPLQEDPPEAEAPSEPKSTAAEGPPSSEPDAPAPAGSGDVEPGLLEALEQEGAGKEPGPWLGLEPLPPLDQILPEHISYVRSVVARFSVTPTHWREDLVQEVMIEAHRSRESRLDVRALLFGITRHVVFHWMAKRDAERSAAALHPGREAITDRSVEDDWQEAERREAVQAAIDELPDIFREVFVRTEIEHMKMTEIARDLGIPLNTGYTRLHLARARFLESLQRLLARRRIQKQDLSAPVLVGAAGALCADTFAGAPPELPGRAVSSAGKAAAAKAGLPGRAVSSAGKAAASQAGLPGRAVSSAGKAAASQAGVLASTGTWLGGLASAAALAIGVWIALASDDDTPDTTATAEPRTATSSTAPDEAASSTAHAPGPPTAELPEPNVIFAPPGPTGTEDAPPPDASGRKESGEGLAARAIIGLARDGRRDEALRLIDQFQQKYPNSLYWTQIRDALATPPSEPQDAEP